MHGEATSLMRRLILLLSGRMRVRSAPQARCRASAERIVSLMPAVTEMIFAMGDGARVAAVSSYDHFPPESRGCRRSAGCSIRASSGSSRSSRTW